VSRGKVYLVGAGPGDPGLLTLKGREVLGRAEVVVYDYLANEELLRCVPPTAERIYVGKKGGDHTMSQEELNRLLVEKGKITSWCVSRVEIPSYLDAEARRPKCWWRGDPLRGGARGYGGRSCSGLCRHSPFPSRLHGEHGLRHRSRARRPGRFQS